MTYFLLLTNYYQTYDNSISGTEYWRNNSSLYSKKYVKNSLGSDEVKTFNTDAGSLL